MSFHALIIAGGQGRRLGGVRKADIAVGGRRLIERVAEAFREADLPVLVATGPVPAEWSLPGGCEQVADLPNSGGGPLAGLVAAVAALRERGKTGGPLVTAAVDTPFLPDDYVSRLLNGLRSASVAFSSWGDDFYPPNAAWRWEAIANLPERRSEIMSLRALQTALGAQKVGWDDCPDNPFDNVNTPKDLHRLEQRAKRLAGL